MAEDDDEGFGDFIFAPRSSSHDEIHIKSNGFFATSQPPRPSGDDDDDDAWGDFVAPFSRSQLTPNSISFQFDPSPSDGFSTNFSSQPVKSGFDPFGLSGSSSVRPADSQTIGDDSDKVSKRVEFENPRGPLSLSFFGGEEEVVGGRRSVGNFPAIDSNGFWHQKPFDTVVNVAYSNSKLSGGDILANLYAQSQHIKSESGRDLDSNRLGSVCKADQVAGGRNSGFDDEDDWEFQGASSENSNRVTNFKEQGSFELSGSIGQSIDMISQGGKAGQDTSKFVENDLRSKNASHDVADLFTALSGDNDKNGEVNGRTWIDCRAPTFFQNSFATFPLASGVEVGIGNGIHNSPEIMNGDSDDFGDFMEAASKIGVKHQEDEKPAHEAPAEAHIHERNIVDNSTIPESHRQPLPISIFSNGVVESNDNNKGVLIDGPTFTPRNGIIKRNSSKSIHDIISALYNQGQHVSSVESSRKPAEIGLYPTQKMFVSSPLSVETYSDNNSWDFNDGPRVKENTSFPKTNGVVQKSSITLSDLQTYVDFCARLRGKLCFLASHLLDDAEENQTSDAVNHQDEKRAVSNNTIQEARKVLHDNMEAGVQLDKNLPIDGSLSEFLEILEEQKFQVLESEYHLSMRFPLAEKDWFVAIELLKETSLMEKILTSASANNQSAFIFIWSNIVNTCADELRHGALIWKQAIEKNLQISLLSDPRGQQYVQALGEIYRVVQLLRMSNQVYKPWMLLRMGDQSSFSLIFDECSALWSNSGLEEAFWNLLGVFDSGSGKTVESLLESINRIQEIDAFGVQDSVFHQRSSICQLTLLPEEMLPEMKMVSWNEKRYFLKVANLWANIINHDPPSLPNLKIG